MVSQTTIRRRYLRLAGLTAAGVAAGCLGESGPAATVTVGPDGETVFDPDEVEVETGDTVEFVWDGGGHNLNVVEQPDDAAWDGVAEIQEEGHTHTHAFDVDGRYEYVCDPHADLGMEGTVVVEEATDYGTSY